MFSPTSKTYPGTRSTGYAETDALDPRSSSAERANRGNPACLLAADGGNVIEIAVVVEKGCTVVLSCRRREKVDDASRSVLTCSCKFGLDSSGALTDLGHDREIGERSRSSGRDVTVVLCGSGRIQHFEVDCHACGEQAEATQQRQLGAHSGIADAGNRTGVDEE
jgi:hypothetical protein